MVQHPEDEPRISPTKAPDQEIPLAHSTLSHSSSPSSMSFTRRSKEARVAITNDVRVEKVCVFCWFTEAEITGALECAHLIPHSVDPALPFEIPIFFLNNRASVDHRCNHVLACTDCHELFDLGAFYVDPGNDFSIVKHENIALFKLKRAALTTHFEQTLKARMRVPPPDDNFFPFPHQSGFFSAWFWRQQFFKFKASLLVNSQSPDDLESALSISAALREFCTMCKQNYPNKKCVNSCCKSCCLQHTKIRCTVHVPKPAIDAADV